VARIAENNGSAMKKVADRLVSFERRGGMAAVILSAKAHP